MVDNSENIYVDFDYNNIIVVDPNKIIDEEGKAKERLIRMENLVFYANLECKVLPRTKLAVGVAANDAIQTISVGSLNFLRPGDNDFLNTRWTDEITGKGSLNGDGVNQVVKERFKNPNKSDDYYIRQTINSNGKPGATDNGLLGIKSIRVDINTSFEPVISIKMVDIRGRALFESGDSSPYAAFFNLPYPLFYLTLKGYLGKAIRLPLMLAKFGASFNTQTGNFDIDLNFFTYKYNVLNEITMGGLIATPFMYKTNVKLQEKTGVPNNNANVQNLTITKGFQKIQEVYSEYKAKGLVSEDFPELTIMELKDRLDIFIKNKMDTFVKENLEPLSDCDSYRRLLEEYKRNVYFAGPTEYSWSKSWLDETNFFVLSDRKTRVYTYAKTINDASKRSDADSELSKLILAYDVAIKKNKTLGEDGKYKIGKKPPVSSAINFNITFDTFIKTVNLEDISVEETFIQRKKRKGTDTELELFQVELENEFNPKQLTFKNGTIELEKKYFFFEGDGSFNDILTKMETDRKRIENDIETALTLALADLLQNKNNGVGFTPTVRNVMAVFFASAEAFLRLMDDVHTNAWEKRNNVDRKRVILNPQVAGASQDNVNPGDSQNTPIYPWPQFIVATDGENGQEKYELRYPGDESLIKSTKANRYDVWPEVEFVEEFINGLVEREPNKIDLGVTSNELLDIKRASVNAIEFPITNQVYGNKEEVKYFFEIYERIIYLVNYSKLTRANTTISTADEISNILSEFESINILDSLGGNNSPTIIMKLKNLGFNARTFPQILRQISNSGLGQSWQNYIRGIFNTRYIKNQISNSSFEFIKSSDIQSRATEPQVSITDETKLSDFVNDSSKSNKIDFTDVFPFTNLNWSKKNLAYGSSVSNVNLIMDTKGTLFYNSNKKVITNFSGATTPFQIRPYTNFLDEVNEPFVNEFNLSSIFESKYNNPSEQIYTEGQVDYRGYTGNLRAPKQVSSMFNTPFFTNSIQEGIEKFRNDDPYPFTVPAYLFLNSLPLATPKEFYKTFENGATKDLGYIFASLKKFSAIHKVPYAWLLKIGSVWHRYKTYVESNNNFDILDNSWKNFNSLANYDPVTSAATKTYSLTINGGNVDIVLEDINVLGVGTGATTSTIINVGFYPKLINDFNIFYQGFEIIKSNQQINGTASANGNVLTVVSVNNNVLQVGDILGGTSFLSNTTIVSQINGTPGGAGQYTINLLQNVPNSVFFITNNSTDGYGDTQIQEAFLSGLSMNYVSSAIIDEINTFKRTNTRIIPWSVSVKTPSGKFWYQMPSSGTLVNQTQYECFKSTSTTGVAEIVIPVTGNTAVHNGAIRSFWTASNYGYFDSNKLPKPPYDTYLKTIDVTKAKQENFSFSPINPSTMEELLSIFSKDVLDGFENEFLKFSKSVYDIETDGSTTILGGIQETPTQASFKNFQAIMREMMKIPVITGNTGDEIVSDVQSKQFKSITNYISQFLQYDIYFKFGNPSFYDRKLFLTFSNENVIDPLTWEKYQIITPNSVPVNGNPTLLTSQVNYQNVWKALRTYVGFSSIDELVYKNSGSYITDFFVDFNVAFTEENVKSFAPIIRIYATQKLNQFQTNTIGPPVPPPTTPPLTVAIATLKNLNTISIQKSGPRGNAIYRDVNGIILLETDQTLVKPETYQKLFDEVIIIAFGSTSTNPNDPQYIIRIEEVDEPQYPSTPNTTNQKGRNSFTSAMSVYLSQVDDFLGKIVNNLIPKLQKSLADVNITSEPIKLSKLSGEPQPKLELWDTFKALNDKWISGNDYKTKTLFEDIMFLDRANRNIGDIVLLDVFEVSSLLTNVNTKSSALTYITSLVTKNWTVLTIPNYVNFYNVQEVVKNPKPRVDAPLEFANTLFGTFLNVDYRNSSAKMICTFTAKGSEQPDVKSVDFRFRSDAFDLTRASDNPLIENQINKLDWDKSNRVVGFNVDIGPQNQGVFKNFSVGQNSSLATSESIEILNQMANQANNRGGSTQSVSLYNVYKNRSYTCNVDMLGNALIQPTMYFNLRNVPMFSGSYYITSVSHNITEDSFDTNFEGVRQPVANLPKIDSYIQNLRMNLVSKIKEVLKQKETTSNTQANTNTNAINSNNTSNLTSGRASDINNTTNVNCVPERRYSSYVQDTAVKPVDFDYGTIVRIILSKTSDVRLQIALFYWSYVYTNNGKNTLTIVGSNPSYISIGENQYWGNIGNRNYFCTSVNVPYVEFDNLVDFYDFLSKRWAPRITSLPLVSQGIDAREYVKFCYKNSFANSNNGEQSFNALQESDVNGYIDKFLEAYQVFKTSINNFQ